MFTVEEAIEFVKSAVGESGTCDEEEALLGLNNARELLWDLTNYSAIMEYICIKCSGNCFYLPSAYKKFELAWFGKEVASMGDEWYQAVPGVGYSQCNSCHSKIIDVGGYHVQFQNYDVRPYKIALQAENNTDTGVTITVFGIDELGTRRKEVLVTKNAPLMVQTKRKYVSAIAVIKPKTDGRIRMYAIDPVNADKMLLAIYQPYDVNPSFRKLSIQNNSCRTMTLWVKKKFHTLSLTHELVEFPKQALILATMANTYLRAKDTQEYVNHKQLAKTELMIEMSDMEVNATSPVRFMHQNLSVTVL